MNVQIGRYGQYYMKGACNLSIGQNAMQGTTTAADNTGHSNIALGNSAMFYQKSGDHNIALGYQALYGTSAGTTGNYNIAFGYMAGKESTSSNDNVIIGVEAGRYLATATGNQYIGNSAGRCMCNGGYNVAIGILALQGSTTVSDNTGANNVALGRDAGCVITSGSSNVMIGFDAGDAVTSGSENVIIGKGVDVASASGNNQFIIGIDSNKWICGDSSYNTTVNDISATNFNSTSDIRLKTNIQPIGDPIGKVKQIEGVSFNWKKDNKPALGVIADQVEKILPELVHGDDPKTVNYNGLIGLLIETVKEQQNQIDELKDRISKLE